MSKTTNKFSPEVRRRAVQLVLDNEGQRGSRWQSIAAKIGCSAQTLNKWVKKTEVDSGKRAGVPTKMARRLKALERENRELRQANESEPSSGAGDIVKAGRRRWRLAILMLTGALCLPFFVTVLPPVLDYPNHLARAYLLAFGAQDPVLSAIYRAHWTILPNLAIDLILPPLLHILPLYDAGRIVLAASLLAPLAGILIYSHALFGQRKWWPLASALVGFNGIFLLGFANFLFAIGAAFASAALWLRWRESAPRVAMAATLLGAIVVFFCHIMGLGLLFLLIASYEIGRWTPQAWLGRAACVGAVFVLPAGLLILSPTAQRHDAAFWLPWASKLLFLLEPMLNYRAGFDAVCLGIVLACLFWLVARGWLIVPRQTRVTMIVLAAGFVIAPFYIAGGTFFDARLEVMLGYVLFAGLGESSTLPARTARVLSIGFVLLFGVRLGALGDIWRAQDRIVAETQAVVQPITPGARVMMLDVTHDDAPDFWRAAPAVLSLAGIYVSNTHLPLPMVVARRAFVQRLFAEPTQQPLAVLPPYSELITENVAAASYTALGRPAPADRHYLVDWQRKFDFVLIINAGGMRDPEHFLPQQLTLERVNDAAALYRVHH